MLSHPATPAIAHSGRQLEHPVISTRREVHLPHRSPHQRLTRPIQLAELPYLSHSHVGIADNVQHI